MDGGEKEGWVSKASNFVVGAAVNFVGGALPSLSAAGLLVLGGAGVAAIQGRPMNILWQGAAVACACVGAIRGLVHAFDNSGMRDGGAMVEGAGFAGGAALAGIATVGLLHAGKALWAMDGVVGPVVGSGVVLAGVGAAVATTVFGGVTAMSMGEELKDSRDSLMLKLSERRDRQRANEEGHEQKPQLGSRI